MTAQRCNWDKTLSCTLELWYINYISMKLLKIQKAEHVMLILPLIHFYDIYSYLLNTFPSSG